ncbi:MAG: response regulator [Planctomycetes bacterium]|nr:response regulator [Planctomycetota bacterium]
MTLPRLLIAYGDESSRRTNVVAETLRSLGHEVVTHDDQKSFLSSSEPDLYVLGRALADGTHGLDLLQALRGTGRSAPIVLIDERPSFEDLRLAVELGASDVVLRPLEAGELARAIEKACAKRSPKPQTQHEPSTPARTFRYVSEAPANAATLIGRAAREVSAFLVNEGVANAHRVRIASAVAELVDNACRHAYYQRRGEIQVHAEIRGARVLVTVSDAGSGFDAARAKLERVPAALPGARKGSSNRGSSSSTGLGRVERLCEEHTIHSDANGTRIELAFELSPVRFEEEAEHLSETDFLDPARARTLVASLRKGRADLSGVAPGMALTIGRILGGLDVEVRPPTKRA